MAYFNAGAWWTSSGQAYASEAEAKAAEGSGAGAGSSADEFARAMGTTAPKPVAAPASAVAGPTVAQAQAQQNQAGQVATGAQTAINNAGYLNQRAKDQSGSLYIGDDAQQKNLADQRAGVTGREYRTNDEQAQWESTHQRSFAGNLARDPITAAVLAAPLAVTGAGAAVGGAAALGFGSGAAIGGGGLAAPAGASFGAVGQTAPAFAAASPFGPGALATAAGTAAGASQGLSLAQKAALGIGALGVIGGLSTSNPKTGQAGTATPPPLNAPAAPTFPGLQALSAPGSPGMTPAQMLQGVQGQNIGGGYQAPASLQNAAVATQPSPTRQAAQTALGGTFDMSPSGGTAAGAGAPVRPSSAQQDSIVQQMLAQGQVRSAYNPATAGVSSAGVSSAGTAQGYDATAGTAQGYNATAGTSQGFDAQGYAAQAGQAAQVLADSGQRDQARNLLLDTAATLREASTRDIPEMYADQTQYQASKAQTNSIIQQLLAAAKMPEGPSAAEALMLTAQERAVRNAYGDAGSLAGGWRSQLTGQRRALGQAATQQADIAAQLGALRAQETATNRDRQVTAFSNAGGLSNQLAGFDENFALSDADRNANLKVANQSNRRESLAAAGGLQSQMLNSDTAFSTSNADRAANTNIANAGFTTQANIATANNMTGASVASAQNRTQSSIANASFQTQASIASAQNQTSASQTNANNQTSASIASANNRTSASQTNANNQTASSIANAGNQTQSSINNANNATQTSISNANNRTIVDQNNASNALTSLQNAGVLASNTRQQDMSLSIAQANNLTSAAIANANLQGSVFATQMQAAIAQQDAALKQQQINNLQQQVNNAQKGVKIGGVSVSQNSLSALQQTLGIISLM